MSIILSIKNKVTALNDRNNFGQKIVLLLANVIENFRETAFENYGLDPYQYIRSLGTSHVVEQYEKTPEFGVIYSQLKS